MQVGKYASMQVCKYVSMQVCKYRSLGALGAPTSSWMPFGFVLCALRALRPFDPRIGDWIVCLPLDSQDASMQVCKYASMQVCKYASMQEGKYASMQVCRYAGMHVCKYASSQVLGLGDIADKSLKYPETIPNRCIPL